MSLSDSASSFSEFRPISMVGCIYKLLSKVLANRFKLVLPSIIGEAQSVFISGKQILDGVLIANEVIHQWKISNSGGLIIKIDFENAFDYVNWMFLIDMLNKLGCGQRWCSWILECISSSHLSILINGSSTENFQPQRGLRQGDPLSPFLFNIVVEAMNLMLERAKAKGLLSGVQVGPNGINLTHLQFADDTLILCNNNLEELMEIKRILRFFQVMSGLKINFDKSMIYGIKIPKADILISAQAFGCKQGSLPIKYFGLPLGANPKKASTWQPIVERVKKKLSLRKKRHLSIGGRLALIKSTLGNLSIYYMSIFKMPVSVAKSIEKLQRNFLWG